MYLMLRGLGFSHLVIKYCFLFVTKHSFLPTNLKYVQRFFYSNKHTTYVKLFKIINSHLYFSSEHLNVLTIYPQYPIEVNCYKNDDRS